MATVSKPRSRAPAFDIDDTLSRAEAFLKFAYGASSRSPVLAAEMEEDSYLDANAGGFAGDRLHLRNGVM